MPVTAQIDGLDETIEYFASVSEDMHGNPIMKARMDAALLVTGDARRLAPIDRGGLRASIVPDVITESNSFIGIVGSNKVYAPAQELGTKPFWPPLQPLIEWVRRKGLATGGHQVYAVAKGVQRAIARRGIRPKEFLTQAVEQNQEKIFKIFEGAVDRIIKQ